MNESPAYPDAEAPIVYCHCAYAQVLPEDVKEDVLRQLCESGRPFESVADLCEMSARQDPALVRIASTPGVKIAACYRRAVKWLFASGGADLPDEVAVINMREENAQSVVQALLSINGQPVAIESNLQRKGALRESA